MLRKDPNKRASIHQVLRHPWLSDCAKRMEIFSHSELKKIKTLSQPCSGSEEPQRLLTEVDLTMQSLTESQKLKKKERGTGYSLDYGQKSKNVTERSTVLAPFNSTITHDNFQQYLSSDVAIEGPQILKFSDKVREANREYEFNYNDEVDNGIMISVNDQQPVRQQAKPTSSEPVCAP